MQLLRGEVAKLIFATETSGGEHGTSTSHVATFQLSSSPVRLKMPDSMIIAEGDSIVVAGTMKRGVLNAVAYRNLTNGALGKGPVVLHFVMGAIFTIIGLGGLLAFIGIPFLLVGIWALVHATHLSNAYSAVEGAA